MLVVGLMPSPSQFTYNRPRAKKGASGSIVDISSDLITKIKSKRPETVGAGRPILLIVKPEFEGGKTVSLRYTPDWRRPYQAVITVSPSLILAQLPVAKLICKAACGVNQQTIGEFHGIPRTIYLADGSLSPGYWPLHNSQDPSDRSAWTEALARVQCAPLFQEQVDDLGATSAGWIPDLTPGQDARLWPVTVVTLLGTQGIVIGASLALTITQPMFHEADQVPLLNTTSGRRWGSVPYE
jgi:hypothetical protein